MESFSSTQSPFIRVLMTGAGEVEVFAAAAAAAAALLCRSVVTSFFYSPHKGYSIEG